MSDCTCDPERAPKPCPKRYQYSECVLAAEVERLRAALEDVHAHNLRLANELAAERERCAQLVGDWVRPAMGDRVEPLLAAIRKGEP